MPSPRSPSRPPLWSTLPLLAVALASVGCSSTGTEAAPSATPETTIEVPETGTEGAETETGTDVGRGTMPETTIDAPETGTEGALPADPAGIVLLSAPAPTTTDRHASFVFDGETTECQLDNQVIEPCRSALFLPDVGPGSHTFTIRGGDEEVVHRWETTSLWDAPTPDLAASSKQPEVVAPNSWRGIFRINCDISHSSYDDPIVFPGQQGAAHLHRFYGNTEVDHATTVESLYTVGSSTCQGNELNRSSYWIPALLAPDRAGGWTIVPAVVGGNDEAHEVFYYSAGVDDLGSIRPVPAGLRIVAGDPSATPDTPQSFDVVRWHCQSWESSDAANPRFSATIPECRAPDRVRLDIFFPSCWNGVDLDAPDHQSHMAYPVSIGGERRCPDSHPVPIVRPSYHYAFGVKPDVYDPATMASTGWRLSADSYTVDEGHPGGASLHGDWFNGWHPEVMEAILEVCVQGGLDCHDGNLANGFRLGDVRRGVDNEPEIIDGGRGHGH